MQSSGRGGEPKHHAYNTFQKYIFGNQQFVTQSCCNFQKHCQSWGHWIAGDNLQGAEKYAGERSIDWDLNKIKLESAIQMSHLHITVLSCTFKRLTPLP